MTWNSRFFNLPNGVASLWPVVVRDVFAVWYVSQPDEGPQWSKDWEVYCNQNEGIGYTSKILKKDRRMDVMGPPCFLGSPMFGHFLHCELSWTYGHHPSAWQGTTMMTWRCSWYRKRRRPGSHWGYAHEFRCCKGPSLLTRILVLHSIFWNVKMLWFACWCFSARIHIWNYIWCLISDSLDQFHIGRDSFGPGRLRHRKGGQLPSHHWGGVPW